MLTRRIVLLVMFVFLAPVAAGLARPAWATQVGLDVWNLPALHEKAESEWSRSGDLEAEDFEVLRRIEVKEDLIQNLIAGRSNLAETTAQFAVLNQDYPEYMEVIRSQYPEATDRERLTRNVIDYISPRLARESWLSAVVVIARLKAELREINIDVEEVDSN